MIRKGIPSSSYPVLVPQKVFSVGIPVAGGSEKVIRRRCDPAPDTERRRRHTMYAFGMKPAP